MEGDAMMLKSGFLRFCDNPEIACCKAERELEQLRTENASLREQLAESQRRERAAVEDLKLALIDETLDPCNCCEYGRTNHCTHPDGPTCGETGGKNFEWRGQQAGKGEAE
jgi:uncharacterized Fe-S radical SAM superfamily protein PflX